MVKKDRTETLLALILLQQMKSASQQEKIVQLNIAGFSNLEIANILGTTTAVVSQSLYAASKVKLPKKTKKAKVKLPKL